MAVFVIDGASHRQYSAAVEEGSVPRILVQPISYGDAVHFDSLDRIQSKSTSHNMPIKEMLYRKGWGH